MSSRQSSISWLFRCASLCVTIRLLSTTDVSASGLQSNGCLQWQYKDEDLGCQPCDDICHPQRDTKSDCDALCKGYVYSKQSTTEKAQLSPSGVEQANMQDNSERSVVVTVTVTVALCSSVVCCVLVVCLCRREQCAGHRNKVCDLLKSGPDSVAQMTQPDQDDCATELCVSHRSTSHGQRHYEVHIDIGASSLTAVDQTNGTSSFTSSTCI